MTDTEAKNGLLSHETKGYDSYNINYHYISKGNELIFKYSLGQIPSCCGTALLSNATIVMSRNSVTQDIKDFIFCRIYKYCIDAGLRNIIFTDILEGNINYILKDKFNLLHSYRNVNTNNIVEIREYTIDPEEFDYPDDYDENGADYDD